MYKSIRNGNKNIWRKSSLSTIPQINDTDRISQQVQGVKQILEIMVYEKWSSLFHGGES